MYIPDHFREARPEVLHDAMRQIGFATLVTHDVHGGLEANHLPMLVEGNVLRGHVARANTVWKSGEGDALAIFLGPHGYVSPSWYPSKAETGKAPQAYARQIRLRTAAWLLTSSDKTVADIASSCGFSDASHLGREFRKQFGLPPMMYREQRGTASTADMASATHAAEYDEIFPGRAQAI